MSILFHQKALAVFPWKYLIIALLSLLYLKNYWLAEDAYINFRSLDQLFAGHGPVWNVGERVQVYTSALWYWLSALARLVMGDLYWATFFCSFILFVLTLSRVLDGHPQRSTAFACVALLASSNCFMDFSASGLENVLLFYLIALFFFMWTDPQTRKPLTVYLLGALLLLTRHDQLILIIPVIAASFLMQCKKEGPARALTELCIGFSPFVAWSVFSLLYYGFPFPNTAYAKLSTGIPKSELIERGFDYFLVSSRYDWLLPAVLVAGLATGLRMPHTRLLAVGGVLTFAYVIYVGGDYMQGRFFSPLYFIATLMLCQGLARLSSPIQRCMLTAAILASCAMVTAQSHHTPLITGTHFAQHIKHRGTADERGIFYASTSISAKLIHQAQGTPFPGWPFYAQGLELASRDTEHAILINIGMTGYGAGLRPHLFDRLALAEPLLARLPALPGPWDPGHFVRDLPWGYLQANLYGDLDRIYDEDLKEYYRVLRSITRSPELFSWERIGNILRANLSPSYGRLRQSHIERWSQRGCKICLDENKPPETTPSPHP